MKNTKKQYVINDVNFDNFTLQKKEISINGKALPLKIGDKFKLSDNDKLYKTIMAITICEDGRVSYTAEWYDPDTCQFNTDSFTLCEFKLLNSKSINKIKHIGFEQ
jgi:hypothetical protein